MRRGTLDDSGTDESTANFDRRMSRSARNHYVQQSTSTAASRIVHTARKSTSRQQNVSNISPVGAARRKMNYKQREMKQLKQIAKLQNTTNLLIPKKPFCRLVREISMTFNSEVTRYTEIALQALQEATEMFLTQVLSDAYLLTLHRKQLNCNISDAEKYTPLQKEKHKLKKETKGSSHLQVLKTSTPTNM